MTATADTGERTLAYLAGIPADRVKDIGPRSMAKLAADNIRTVADLLLTTPRRYLDRSQLLAIRDAPIGEAATVGVVVDSVDKRRISRRRTLVEVRVSDGTSQMRVVWFNPYINVKVGEELALTGKVELFKKSFQMSSPDYDRIAEFNDAADGFVVPIYGAVGGMKPPAVKRAVANALRRSVPVADVVPEELLTAHDLVGRSAALEGVHTPNTTNDVAPARRRLIFDEFLRIQMALKTRAFDEFASQIGVKNSVRGELFDRFTASLQYTLTGDQIRVLDQLLSDMSGHTPMHRLLQGEVGSGKTVVVIAALLTSVESGHQGAVMAPTEVLATQHYLGTEQAIRDAGMAPNKEDRGASGTESLFGDEPLSTRPVRIGLFTGSRVTTNFVLGDVSRSQGLEWLSDGSIDIAFGTQALIQPDVSFLSLGIVVVDEQHRFGVEQRVMMRDRNTGDGVPDLLLMTATPIPRTLAMTLYGDLDVSVIEELPPGRHPIATRTLDDNADNAIDRNIDEAVAVGRQVFVVCPLVEDSEKIEARSATTEYARINASRPDLRTGLLHGQLRSDEKSEVMRQFRSGDIDVLVATTVVEVGIDVPNATLMVIRTADRFGLSQLHQLRGRIGRGVHPGVCLLSADAGTPDGERRIEAMVSSNDGFALAEIDLEIRGQGTVFGGSQSGVADLRMGDILADFDLLDIASRAAADAVESDPHGAFVTEVMHEVAVLFGDSAEWLTRS